MIIGLKEAYQHDKKIVGNKAWNVSYLKSHGYLVPDGFCLTSLFFSNYLEFNSISLDSECIQDDIMQGKYTHEQVRLIGAFYTDLEDKAIVAVRSSGANEDDHYSSMAGIYKSILHVSKFRDLLHAIKICWASFCLDSASFAKENVNIFVQKQLAPEWSGVLFTQDPILKDDSIYIEIVQGMGDSLVNGTAQSRKVTYRPSVSSFINEESAGIDSIKPLLLDLAMQAIRIKELLGGDQDIEWAFQNDKVYILQARPIVKRQLQLDSIEIISGDNIDRVLRVEPGNIREYYSDYIRKHLWINNFARINDIHIPAGYFIIYNRSLADKIHDNDLARIFKTDVVSIQYKGTEKKKISETSKLKESMIKIAEELDDDEYIVVYIREYIPNELSGFSTMSHNNVIIEYSIGGLMGLGSGMVAPSTCIIDDKMEITSHNFCENDYYFLYDSKKMSFEYSKYEGSQGPLSECLLKGIFFMTNKISGKFLNARIEWYIYDDRIYLKDLSLEESTNEICPDIGHIMSPGIIKGEIIKLENMDLFHELLIKYDISVNASPDRAIAERSESLVDLIDRIKEKDSAIILAEYPIPSLSILMGHVAGFIFEKGSLLSHLGIILRENKIPAILMPGSMEEYCEGEMVNFDEA